MKFIVITCFLFLAWDTPCSGQSKEKNLEIKPIEVDSIGTWDSLRNNAEIVGFGVGPKVWTHPAPLDIPNSWNNQSSQSKDDSYTPIYPLKGDANVTMPGTEALDRLDRKLPKKDTLRESKPLLEKEISK